MEALNSAAIATAVLAAFVFSSGWYIAFGKVRAQLSTAAAAMERPPVWMMPVELARTLALALVLAGLASVLKVRNPVGGVELALALWVGFPFILLTGSVLYENVPSKLAAIHAGDWLAKLLIVAVFVSVWH